MNASTSPTVGVVLCLLLVAVGWYMTSAGSGTADTFGALFLGVGVVGALANGYLVWRERRAGSGRA